MLTKELLRSKFSLFRSSLSPEYRTVAHRRIFHKLISDPHIIDARNICCYVSHETEVDTHEFIRNCLSKNKQVVVPKVSHQILTLHEINSLEECKPGFKGILEPPSSNRLCNPELVDVFIVLGLVFDTHKYRIGYGKGYTDRLLEKQRGFKIGIAYTDQLVYEVPHESHDVPLNTIITDTITLF